MYVVRVYSSCEELYKLQLLTFSNFSSYKNYLRKHWLYLITGTEIPCIFFSVVKRQHLRLAEFIMCLVDEKSHTGT